MSTTTWTGVEKSRVRTAAIKHCKHPEHAVFMPSVECFCVRQALREGRLSSDANVTLIERNDKIIPSIYSHTRNLPNKKIVNKELASINLQKIVEEKGLIDYAFFDICGGLTAGLRENILSWAKCFSKKSTAVFTFCASRGKGEAWSQFKNGRHIDPEILKKIRNVSLFMLPKAEFEVYTLLKLLERNYHTKILFIEEYRDTSPMVTVAIQIVSQRKGLTKSEQLGCWHDMPSALKQNVVKKALKGTRPAWITPAQWAWHALNPNGIRAKA